MLGETKHAKLWAWINLGLYALTLAVNFLGSSGYINGMSQKAVSDKYPTLITPAPFTFSIWGLIYLLMLATIVYMLVKQKTPQGKKLITLLSPLFWLNCILNMGWIISFSYELLGLSVLLIFGILLPLTMINRRILEHKSQISFRLPSMSFALYAGWVTIATVVNIAAFLVKTRWNGFGIADTTWTAIILLASLAIVFFINTRLKSAVYPLPIAWAYFGIMMSQKNMPGLYQANPSLRIIVILGILACLAMAVSRLIKNKICVLPEKD